MGAIVAVEAARHQGRYLPVAALAVHAPEALGQIDPQSVVLMNPVYVDEVRAHLATLGVWGATLLMVNDLREGQAGLALTPTR